MATAAQRWGEMVRARAAQKAEIATPLTETRWAAYAPSYRFDPRRQPEPSLAAALEYVESDDVVVEIGGGAGRIGLPMALRARALVNVEPSPAMREQFVACAAENGIANARSISALWPANVDGDLIVSADVIYFVEEIAEFLRAMTERARRRAVLLTWSVPPPNVNAELFRIALGAEEAPAPGIRELLPVLEELGIAPELRELDEAFTWPERLPEDEEAAIKFALDEVEPRDRDAAQERVAAHIRQLFDQGAQPWQPLWRIESRAVIASWETG